MGAFRAPMYYSLFIIWQAFVLINRAIWLAADEAGFSHIACGQYAIFIALRREPSFKRQKVSLKVFQTIQKEEI
jgi:hypothetical protein